MTQTFACQGRVWKRYEIPGISVTVKTRELESIVGETWTGKHILSDGQNPPLTVGVSTILNGETMGTGLTYITDARVSLDVINRALETVGYKAKEEI